MDSASITINGVEYIRLPKPADKLETLGKTLRAARKSRRYSLARAAAEAGFTKSYLWEVENECRRAINPSFRLIARLARLYGLDLQVLAEFVPTIDEEIEGDGPPSAIAPHAGGDVA